MFRTSIFSFLLLASASIFGADCCGGRPDLNAFKVNGLQRDYPILYQNLTTKRSIPVNEKSKNLTFSGDIRSAWAHLREDFECQRIRGEEKEKIKFPSCNCMECNFKEAQNVPFPQDVFGAEFNFYVDYVQQCAWGVVWLQYSNAAGLVGSLRKCDADHACRGSGTCEGICLRKAYIGYNVIADGCTRIDLEIGRRPLWSVFDSRVEFEQNFDGVILRSSYNLMGYSDLYANVAGFVIDERSHHYGFVGEAGYLNILDTGVDLKYSLIDWRKRGANRCGLHNAPANQFLVSQVTGYYNLDYDFLWNNMQLYGAVLFNSAAKEHPVFLNKKHDFGWYAGFLVGQVCKEGDWALDVNFQYVQAQTLPHCDLSGIGNGNALANCFDCAETPETAIGRTNYKGWRFEALYAFSDNFILDVLLQFSSPIEKKLGGKHNFSQFQLEAIYAF